MKYRVHKTEHRDLKRYRGKIGELIGQRPTSNERASDYDILRLKMPDGKIVPFFRYELEEVAE